MLKELGELDLSALHKVSLQVELHGFSDSFKKNYSESYYLRLACVGAVKVSFALLKLKSSR